MLIVFEGIDGSGKSTQVKLFPADKKLSFPRYNKFFGKIIRLVLTKKWASRLNPYAVSFFYAVDRWLAKPQINSWLAAGKTVLLDRYTYSSMAHQGAKLEGAAQVKLVNWIDWLENNFFKLPLADNIIYINVPPRVSQKLLRSRRKDLADADMAYQQKTAKVYEVLAKRFKFTVINCVDKQNRLLSKDDVAKKVAAAAKSLISKI
ncbi:deoxynucleoside kinase [Patescibacteria group bacterium]|nr:deoxynucleoside kinase [Patescibacteria group bacterium]